MTLTSDAALNVFKALAHESRLKLLGHLAAGERSVQELSALAGISEPTASHHLALLRTTGLVSMRAEGTTHWYRFDAAALRRTAREAFAPETIAGFAAPPKPMGDDRIVANYLGADGRLKAFPAQRKKRRAVLAWFARMFEEGRRYAEKEVNTIISARHHDFETFRREMVGHRMLAREKGVYWRLPERDWSAA